MVYIGKNRYNRGETVGLFNYDFPFTVPCSARATYLITAAKVTLQIGSS